MKDPSAFLETVIALVEIYASMYFDDPSGDLRVLSIDHFLHSFPSVELMSSGYFHGILSLT